MAYTDETIIQFGKHKGEKLANVPSSYLLWVGDQEWCGWELESYISDNRDSLEAEAKQE